MPPVSARDSSPLGSTLLAFVLISIEILTLCLFAVYMSIRVYVCLLMSVRLFDRPRKPSSSISRAIIQRVDR